MKRLVSLMLILCLLIGCAPAQSRSVLTVYRVISPEYQTAGELLRTEQVTPRGGESELDALLRALSSASTDDRVYNPISGIEVLGCTTRDNLAVLELGGDYAALSGLDKTLADACCALTLCSLEEIDRVSIASGGLVVTVGLSPDDMYLDPEGMDSTRRQVCLYYTDESGESLIPEYRSLSTAESGRAERYIVEELLRERGSLISPLPDGTELLGVTRKGRICTLNLSEEFLENRPDSPEEELTVIYSLVNSLASLGGISGVLITVEGEPVGDYVNLSLANPISPLPFLPAEPLDQSSMVQSRLYFSCESGLSGIPCLLDGSGDTKQAVLNYLMGSPGFGCYESLFGSGDELQHLSTSQGVSRISLSRSFFERRSPEKAALALDALALSLLELPDVASVLVTYPDGSVPRLPDRDLKKPLLPKT